MSTWHGELTAKNIGHIALMIRERLEGKTFAIASVYVTNRPNPRLELRTGCTFEPDWTDGSKEPVRVMSPEAEPWLGFSAGRWFWSFHLRTDDHTRFSFDHDGFQVEFVAPCGDWHRHAFRAERP